MRDSAKLPLDVRIRVNISSYPQDIYNFATQGRPGAGGAAGDDAAVQARRPVAVHGGAGARYGQVPDAEPGEGLIARGGGLPCPSRPSMMAWSSSACRATAAAYWPAPSHGSTPVIFVPKRSGSEWNGGERAMYFITSAAVRGGRMNSKFPGIEGIPRSARSVSSLARAHPVRG